MSTHPNTILLLTLTPDNTSRKTWREILSANNATEEDSDIKIAGESYHSHVLESDYEEGYQIAGKEGDILVFDFLTYGYGDQIDWAKAEAQKTALEEWAKATCEKYACSYRISLTANYW